jgi:hypothetical protein
MALTGIGEPLTQMKIRGMKIVLTLEKGTFPETGANTKTIYTASLPGYLHIEANINRLPAWQGNTASVIIYGMTKDDCIAATKFNPINIQFYNQIQIYAGYLDGVVQNPDKTYDQDSVIAATNNLPLVFLGQLVMAAPNFNNPNRPFVIQALLMTQALATLNQTTSTNNQTNLSIIVNSMITSYNGTSPAPQIVYQLDAVYPDTVVNNSYYVGSFAQQLQQICEDYGYQIRISFPNNAIDQNTQLITLTKIGTAPPNAPVQDLNSETGMIGYPEVMPFGIMAREFYNPLRSINDQINLQTNFTAIAGNYYVWQIQSILQTHGDLWESTLVLYGFNNSAYA